MLEQYEKMYYTNMHQDLHAMKNNKLLRELIETLLNFFVLQPQLSQDLRELAIALRLYPMLLGLLS